MANKTSPRSLKKIHLPGTLTGVDSGQSGFSDPDDARLGPVLARVQSIDAHAASFAKEQDPGKLLGRILSAAMTVTHADGGSIHTVTEQRTLRPDVFLINSLNVAHGPTEGPSPVDLPEVPLYDEDGQPNLAAASARIALENKTIAVDDVTECADYRFSNLRRFEEKTGYRATSYLGVPLRSHNGDIIGVMQLLNAHGPDAGGDPLPFSAQDKVLVASLANHGASALVNLNLVQKLNRIGIALSSERNSALLLETILLGVKDLTRADAGTLYRVTDAGTLKFEILRTDSLGIAMGGTTGVPINFPELPLYKDGQPNLQMVAAYAVLKDKMINIPDAYEAEGFDFTGTRAFDKKSGYRSKSFLTVPLKNHENEIIGVIQLINATNPVTREIRPFSPEDEALTQSLASQAAIALTNQKLIADLKQLFESFIKTIAGAIDDKSPYTGGHCHRVPVLAEMLARAAGESDLGDLQAFHPTEDEMYEIRIAAWLHDCGKVVTPEYVVDKSTKLETIYDRIHTVNTRFEVLKRDARIDSLNRKVALLESGAAGEIPALEQELEARLKQIEDDRLFIAESNVGGEFMSDERQKRVNAIAGYEWTNADGQPEPFLSENEVYNLNIAKGTLTHEEREIINHHVVATKKMLDALPFPKNLKRVPEMAGSHHETMIGTGYPNKLTREQMSVPARIMAIADVFEALTASDRPYKQAKTLSSSLKILGFMKKDQHIDPDLFQVFVSSGIYREYAEKYLDPSQIDEVDVQKIPGYDS